MLSHNNWEEQIKKYEPKEQRFTIKKLTVGVASVLLGVAFAGGTASADTANASADSSAGSDSSEQTDHQLVLNSANASLKNATAANQSNNASAAVQNPAGDINATTANDYEAAVKAAMDANATAAKTTNPTTENQATTQAADNNNATADNVETQNFNVPTADVAGDVNYANAFQSLMLFASPRNFQNNDSAVDLANFNPTINYQNPYTNNNVYGVSIPETQYAYSAAIDKKNGNKVLVWTTDKANPGQTLYFYVGSTLAATINATDKRTQGFNVNIYNTNDPSFYQGGHYTYDYTKARKAVGGYTFYLNNVKGIDGSKVNNGISGNFSRGNSNMVFQRMDGSGDLYNTNPTSTSWTSVSALAPTEVTQHIYYVNADTGELMATKEATGLSGQKYNLTTSAAPENVTWKGSQYKLVDSSQASDKAMNTVLATNNGVNITAKSVADAPLKGTLGQFRPGNIYSSVVNYGQGVLFIQKGRIPDADRNIPEGTTDSNAYELHVADQPGVGGRNTVNGDLKPNGFMGSGGLSSVYFRPGDEVGGAIQGGTGMHKNTFTPGNQDIVLFYKGAPQPVENKVSGTITYIDDTDGTVLDARSIGEGNVGDLVSYNSKNVILHYEGLHYKKVKSNFTDGSTTFKQTGNDYEVHFVHATQDNTETRDVKRTINYVGKESPTSQPTPVHGAPNGGTSYQQTASFTRTNTTDLVTNTVKYGQWSANGSTTFAAVPSNLPQQIGYDKVDIPSVGSIQVTPDTHISPITVTYTKNPAPVSVYKQGNTETKTVKRIINYYDRETGAKIPANLINQNPVTQEVTFTRNQVLDGQGNVIGYGKVVNGGTNFVPQDWHDQYGQSVASFDAKRSQDLSANSYTAAEYLDGSSAEIVAANQNVTANTPDETINVYYGHQKKNVTRQESVKRNFHYIFTDGTKPSDHLVPTATQTVQFTGTAVKDMVTGVTGPTTWAPSTGYLVATAAQPVAGYDITGNVNANPDGSTNNIAVQPGSSDIDVTLVYTPQKPAPVTPQRATVQIIDKTDNNKLLTTFNNDHGEKGSQISFDGQPATLQSLLNSGYKLDSAVDDTNGNAVSIANGNTITFPAFDSNDNNVQSFKIYLVHGTHTNTTKDTNQALVHYIVADGKVDAPADNVQHVTWTKTDTVDDVTGKVTEGTWTPDKTSYGKVTTPALPGYTTDTPEVKAITAVHGVNPVNVVVYNPAPVEAQKADLTVFDKKTGKQLNVFTNSGKAGEPIAFSGADGYVNNLTAQGYVIDSFVNDANQPSTPGSYSDIRYDNYDNDAKVDQHFKLYLDHQTEEATEQKQTTSTVHYKVSDGAVPAPTDNVQTINWTRPGTKDKVTGEFTPTGNWTTPDQYNNVQTPPLEGYTADRDNVPGPVPSPNENPETTVTYTPKAPEAITYTATPEVRTVTRTINYYDQVTGEKIPNELIAGNPTTQTVQITRNHVVSSTGQDMGLRNSKCWW